MEVNIAHYIQKLNNLIANNPAFADLPFKPVMGIPTTPREALAMLQRGEAVSEVIAAMNQAGMDPIEEDWILVADYYRRLLKLPGPHPKVYSLGQPEMTLEEALTHVSQRDAKGQELLRSYQGMLTEMARRMK